MKDNTMHVTHGDTTLEPPCLEMTMTNRKNTTPVTIDAIIREARAERAEHMRMVAVGLYARLKRFFAGFRPINAQTPRRRAVA